MSNIKSFKNPFVLHSFLFGLVTTIFLFAQNIHLVKFQDLFSPISIIIIITIILLVTTNIILKNKKKSAFIVSLGLMLFLSYGFIYEVLDDSIESNLPHKYLLPIFPILFIIGTIYFIKTSRRLDNATKIVNAVGVVIILISFSNVVIYYIEGDSFTSDFSLDNQITTINYEDNLPDVYYIILDAYTGSEALEIVFNYDNNEFYNFLKENGFYVPKKSHSNYPQSYQSITSSLNMEYINEIDSENLQKRQDIAYKMVENNKVMKNFKTKGYTIFNINSGWGPTREMPNADINLCNSYRGVLDSELFSMIVNKSILDPYFAKLFENDRRELLLCHFSTLPKISKITDEPVFVFAHITIPHKPYVFGPNGESITPKYLQLGIKDDKDKEGYLGQLQYTNKLVKQMVSEILEGYEEPPIIIIQGDHGSESSEKYWMDFDEDAFQERFSILNVFLVPNDGQERFYDTITPVNTFRILFNNYFGDSFEMLDDKMYFAEQEKPWKFIEITEIIIQN